MDIALANARNAFLDLIAESTAFVEEPDGDVDSNGRMVDCTTISIRASSSAFAQLAAALGIEVKSSQTVFDAMSEAASF